MTIFAAAGREKPSQNLGHSVDFARFSNSINFFFWKDFRKSFFEKFDHAETIDSVKKVFRSTHPFLSCFYSKIVTAYSSYSYCNYRRILLIDITDEGGPIYLYARYYYHDMYGKPPPNPSPSARRGRSFIILQHISFYYNSGWYPKLLKC